MSYLILICDYCGHKMKVSPFVLGAKGRCARCNRVLVVSEQNTQPYTSDKSAILPKGGGSTKRDVSESASAVAGFTEPQASAPVLPRDSTCARCGKPFRGEWDRNPTPQGTLCHICSRLITEQTVPVVLGKTADEPPPSPESYIPLQPMGQSPKNETPEVPSFARKHPELFRGVIWALALLVVVLALYFALKGSTYDSEQATHLPAETAPVAISKEIALLVWFFLAFFMLLGHFLALYLTLQMFEKLPSEHILGNVAALILPTFVAAFFGFIPVVGTLFTVLIFYAWLDFSGKMIVAYFILHLLTTILAKYGAKFSVGMLHILSS